MPYIIWPGDYRPGPIGPIQEHHRYGGCYECCDACNYSTHRCHFCGTSLNHDSTEYGGERHWLSDCRPDLILHWPGPDCTCPGDWCYADQEENGHRAGPASSIPERWANDMSKDILLAIDRALDAQHDAQLDVILETVFGGEQYPEPQGCLCGSGQCPVPGLPTHGPMLFSVTPCGCNYDEGCNLMEPKLDVFGLVHEMEGYSRAYFEGMRGNDPSDYFRTIWRLGRDMADLIEWQP